MIAVIKKELKSYLLSPVGYIFIGSFLAMFSLFFNITNFEYLFYNGATILTFVVPVLTMRMFSEERKNGTEQLILTSPRSLTSIVLGKFFAAAIIMAITTLLTLIYFGILSYFGKPSILVALTTLFGFFVLSLSYISLGMYISSITENQIIACVLTIGAFLFLWFSPGINEIFERVSLIIMFDKFPSGIISVSELINFISFSILFILLTIVNLQRRKSVK